MAVTLMVGVLATVLALGNVQSFGIGGFQIGSGLGGGLAGGLTSVVGLGGGLFGGGGGSGYGSASSSLSGGASGAAGVLAKGGVGTSSAAGIAGGFGAGGYGEKGVVAGGKDVSGVVTGGGHGAIGGKGIFGIGDLIHTGIDLFTGQLHEHHGVDVGVTGEASLKGKGSVEGSLSGGHDIVGDISGNKDGVATTKGGVVTGTSVSTAGDSYSGGGYTSHSRFEGHVSGSKGDERDFTSDNRGRKDGYDDTKDSLNKGTGTLSGSGSYSGGGYTSHSRIEENVSESKGGERDFTGDNRGRKDGYDDTKDSLNKGTGTLSGSGSYSGGGYTSHSRIEENVSESKGGERDFTGDNRGRKDGYDDTKDSLNKGTSTSSGSGSYSGGGYTSHSRFEGHVSGTKGDERDFIGDNRGRKDGYDDTKDSLNKGTGVSTGSGSYSGGSYTSHSRFEGHVSGTKGDERDFTGDNRGRKDGYDETKDGLNKGTGVSTGSGSYSGGSYTSHSRIEGHVSESKGNERDFTGDNRGRKDGYDDTKDSLNKGTGTSSGSGSYSGGGYTSHSRFEGHVSGSKGDERDFIGDSRGRKDGYDETKDGVNKGTGVSTGSGSYSGGGYTSNTRFEGHVSGSKGDDRDFTGDNRGRKDGYDDTKDGLNKGTGTSSGSSSYSGGGYTSHSRFEGHVSESKGDERDFIGDNRGRKDGYDETKDGVNKGTGVTTESGSYSGGGYTSNTRFEGHVSGSKGDDRDFTGDNRGRKDGYDDTKDGLNKGTGTSSGSGSYSGGGYTSHSRCEGHVSESKGDERDFTGDNRGRKDGYDDTKDSLNKGTVASTESGSYSGGGYTSNTRFEGHVSGSKGDDRDFTGDNRGRKDGYDDTKDGLNKGTGTSSGSGSYSGSGYNSHSRFEGHVSGTKSDERDFIGDNRGRTDGHDDTKVSLNKEAGTSSGSGSYSVGGYTSNSRFEGHVSGSKGDEKDFTGDNRDGRDGYGGTKDAITKGTDSSTGSGSYSGGDSSSHGRFEGYVTESHNGGKVNDHGGKDGYDGSKDGIIRGTDSTKESSGGGYSSHGSFEGYVSSSRDGVKELSGDQRVGKDGFDGLKGVATKGGVGSTGGGSISGTVTVHGSSDVKGGVGFGDLVKQGVDIVAGLAGLRTTNVGSVGTGAYGEGSIRAKGSVEGGVGAGMSAKAGSSYGSSSSISSSQSGGGYAKAGGGLFGGLAGGAAGGVSGGAGAGGGLLGGFGFGII